MRQLKLRVIVALIAFVPFWFGALATVRAVDETMEKLQSAEKLFLEKSYRAARDLYLEILSDLKGEERGEALARLVACHEGLRDWGSVQSFTDTHDMPGFPWNAQILQTVGRYQATRYGGDEKLAKLNSALLLFEQNPGHEVAWCAAAFDKIDGLQQSWNYNLRQKDWEAKYGDQEEPEVPWETWQMRRGEEIDIARRDASLNLYAQILERGEALGGSGNEVVSRALLDRGMFRIHSLGSSRGSSDSTPKVETLIDRLEDEKERTRAADWLREVESALEDWRDLLRRHPHDGRADDASFLIAYATENYLLDLVAAIPRYQELRTRYPESMWAETAAARIQRIRQEVVSIPRPNHFPSGAAPLLEATARNVKRVVCRLYPIDEPLALLGGAEALDIDDDADHISWSTDTGCTDDHKKRQFTIVIPEERPGAYLLRVLGQERQVQTVILITDVALNTHTGLEESIAWVTDARTGQPRAGADVEFRLDYRVGRERLHKNQRMKTDDDGVARWKFPPECQLGNRVRNIRVTAAAQLGDHVTLVSSASQWRNSARAQKWRYYFESDRPAYRPKQKAQLKVSCREWTGNEYADAEADRTFILQIVDPRDTVIHEESLQSDAHGAISTSLTLSDECPLGPYTYRISTSDGDVPADDRGMAFRVEEYRLPEFEVLIDAPEETLLVGDPLSVKVRGRFLAGDPVRSGAVRIKVTRSPLQFRFDPPRRYSWYHPRNEHHYWHQEEVFSAEGRLDENGIATFDIPTAEFPDEKDSTYHISAWVTDDAEREETASRPLPVTHTEFFAHIDPKVEVYSAGERLNLEVRTLRPDRTPIESSGEIEIARRHDREEQTEEGPVVRTEWEPIFTGPLTVGEEPARFEEVIDGTGHFKITYRTRDRRENLIEASTTVWVLNPAYTGRGYLLQGVQILTSADEYSVGDTIRGAVVSEVTDATVLLLRSAGGLFTEVATVQAHGHVAQFEFPATSAETPNFFLTAIVVRGGKYYRAQRGVLVPPEQMFLTGTLTATADEVRPGATVGLALKVRDHKGAAVAGSFSLTLYDEAIHAIQPPFRKSPLEHFYGAKWAFDLRHVYSTRFRSATKGVWLGDEPRKYRSRSLPSRFRPWRYQFPYLTNVFAGAFEAPARGGRAGGAWGGDTAKSEARQLGSNMEMKRSRRAAPKAKSPAPAPENSVRFSLSEDAEEEADGYVEGQGGAEDSSGTAKPRLRSRFDETAHWQANFATDATGAATVNVEMPDSLTRWVGVARGITADGRVLEARTQIRTSQKILARLAAPRFFREHDEVVLSALVRNLYAEDLVGKISMQYPAEILEPIAPLKADDSGSAVTFAMSFAANGEARVDVPFRVIGTGEAVVTVVAETKRESDALERRIPALRYGLDRKITGSGVVLDVEGTTSGEWEFIVPEKTVAATRKLEINATASPAIALIESLPYLVQYPYGCVEQTLHRFVPAAVVAQVLSQTGVRLEEILPEKPAKRPVGYWGHLQERPLELFQPGDLQKLIAAGDKRLQDSQNPDGSWGWWAGAPGDPYITALVVDAYCTALGAGVDLPRGPMQRGAEWLFIHLDGRDLAGEAQVYDKPDFEEFAMIGRALFRSHQVLAGAWRNDTSEERVQAMRRLADLLYPFRDRLSAQGKALLAVGIAALEVDGDERPMVLLRNLENHETRKPKWGTTHYGMQSGYSWWYDSGVEATARVLEAFLAISPDDERVREMVRWLLENRQGSHYDSTRSTATVAFALAEYLAKSGELLAEMKVDVVLDGKVVGNFDIRREELFTRRHQIQIPSAPLFAGAHKLELHRRGKGELYWDATLSFYSQEDPIPAGGHRLAVERRYFRLVDTPGTREETYHDDRGLKQTRTVQTTTRNRVALVDGAVLTPGDRVLVEVTVESPQRFRYLMFTDHKPAGLEAVAVRSGYVGGVYSYREFRDAQVLHFASRLPEGETQFAYELRAERSGRFRALPTTAEAMYLPHIHANSQGSALSVEK